MTTLDRPWVVFVHERGKRPRRVDVSIPAGKLPATVEVDGRTYHWTTADISARTLTYVDIKPAVAVPA